MGTGLLVLSLVILALRVPSGYEEAWRRVPDRHQALVRSIEPSYRGHVRYATAAITVPVPVRPSDLWHEVGHLVLAPDTPDGDAWCRLFWPRNKPLGILPSRYARTSCQEDAADSYKEMLEHGCLGDPGRDSFLRARIFRPGELAACSP